MAQLYYTSLNDERRLKAICTIFKRFERDQERLAFVDSLVVHFDWCSDIRNKLLHSELYPERDKLYLVKPTSKNDQSPVYLWLSVRQLRDIADQFDLGKRTCAGFVIKLRVRDIPADQLPAATIPSRTKTGRCRWSFRRASNCRRNLSCAGADANDQAQRDFGRGMMK
jgi:hypothetical protein